MLLLFVEAALGTRLLLSVCVGHLEEAVVAKPKSVKVSDFEHVLLIDLAQRNRRAGKACLLDVVGWRLLE